MQSQWGDWLRELASAGQGGRNLALPAITRGLPYSHTVPVIGDVEGDAFDADLRFSPTSGSPVIATFGVEVGEYEDEITPITLSLNGAALVDEATDDDADGVTEVIFSLFHTPAGGVRYRFAAGVMIIAE